MEADASAVTTRRSQRSATASSQKDASSTQPPSPAASTSGTPTTQPHPFPTPEPPRNHSRFRLRLRGEAGVVPWFPPKGNHLRNHHRAEPQTHTHQRDSSAGEAAQSKSLFATPRRA